MTPGDYTAFAEVIGTMQGLLGPRRPLEELVPAYFRALKAFDFVDVSRAADELIATSKFFPKPVAWIQQIRGRARGEPLEELTGPALADYRAAERAGFEGPCCDCDACTAAGVTDKPLRFAPLEGPDGAYRRAQIGGRSTVRGGWIHGWPLRRWYLARAQCFDVIRRLKVRAPAPDGWAQAGAAAIAAVVKGAP